MRLRLRKWLASKLRAATELGLERLSLECAQGRLSLCSSAAERNCTLVYQERVLHALSSFATAEARNGATPLDVIEESVLEMTADLSDVFAPVLALYESASNLTGSVPSTEPLALGNLVQPSTKKAEDFLRRDAATARSNADVGYRLLKPNADLVRCAAENSTWRVLRWSTVPWAFFHSECLCVASKGDECRRPATPADVDPRLHCLSVLLRDFQRQVWYRPALTYLDLAFQTRVPVCRFCDLLRVSFERDCDAPAESLSLSARCHFKNLVDKRLDCPGPQEPLSADNRSELCAARNFMQFVVCDGDVEDVRLPQLAADDSPLALVLTYVNVAARVFTLVTCLLCPQLRDLPGKVLMGYQLTALLRLVAVPAVLEDFPLAARLDVAADLASTLWLTAYMHFLTTSIATLRLPDSLSPCEARVVLLRYALLGWASSAALSAAFFWTDEALESRVNFGHLFFLLANYGALFGNLYMFLRCCHFYYDVRLVDHGGAFVGLFDLATKTSLLSGAGIASRLVFAQIQPLDRVATFYRALAALQGLLVFALYGCQRHARVFWTDVVVATLARRRRRTNVKK